MAKFCGKIGYCRTLEKKPGVWVMEITDRVSYGDIVKNNRRLVPSDNLNDNITISNQISIVSDPYAFENFHNIRYVEFMGIKWKVINAEVEYPRLILTLGGEYNVEQDTTA